MNKSFYNFEKIDRALAKSFNSFFSFKLPTHLLRSTAIAANTGFNAVKFLPKKNRNEKILLH